MRRWIFAWLLGISLSTWGASARADASVDVPVATSDARSPEKTAAKADAPADEDYATHERGKAHAVEARGDLGSLGWSTGAGYNHLWEQADAYKGLGAIAWFGAGADARLFGTTSDGRVHGAGAFATGRISIVTDAMGVGYELSAGVANLSGRARAIGSASVFFGFLYGEVGYSYQVPLDGGDRQGMIASHMVSLRITIPVHWYDKTMTKEPRHAHEN